MINETILKRKSIKNFLPVNIDNYQVELLFAAASFAPSSMNEQPWAFIIAKREDEQEFNLLVNLMNEKNRMWAKDASLLAVVLAKRNFSLNNKPNKHSFYDVSSAVSNLTYQALSMNLQVHQIGGFDIEKTRAQLIIPEIYDPVVMLAIGYSATEEDALNTKARKNFNEFVFEKKFGNPINMRTEV